MTDGLLVRGLPKGPFSGLIPIGEGLFLQSGLGGPLLESDNSRQLDFRSAVAKTFCLHGQSGQFL